MKSTRFLLFSLLLAGALCCGGQNELGDPPVIPESQDRYLGFVPPGAMPDVFAPGLVSSESNEGGVVIHPGGAEIYFWRVGVEGRSTVFVTRLVDGTWAPPEIASFSGTYGDSYIAMHPDGSRLFFQSDRPIDRRESAFQYNIWYVDRIGDGWSEAKSIGRPINGPNHTGGASVTREGTLYYSIMDIDNGRAKLYRSAFANGAYQEPEELPETVNAFRQNTDSYVAPDESYLVFTGFRGQGHEGNPGTVYVSFRGEEGEWGEAQEIGPAINSEDQFGSVTVSPDGHFLFFPQFNHSSGSGLDIYWVSCEVVEELRR